jgi:hypothetical protein
VLMSTPVDALLIAICRYPAAHAAAATAGADPGTRKLRTASYHSGRVDTRERQLTGSCRPLLMGEKAADQPEGMGEGWDEGREEKTC